MLRFLILICASFCVGLTAAARVPVCNALRFTGSLISSGEAFYSYGFDFSVSVNPNNLTFPNKVRITNFESWSVDPSEIYQMAPMLFTGTAKQCSTMNETCLLDFPNGVTQMLYPIMINGTGSNLRPNQRPFIK